MKHLPQDVEFNAFPVEPLTQEDCDTILEAAFHLFCEGKANGVGVHDDRHYVLVFDCRRAEYFVGRLHRSHYLLTRAETMVACSPDLHGLLAKLRAVLNEN